MKSAVNNLIEGSSNRPLYFFIVSFRSLHKVVYTNPMKLFFLFFAGSTQLILCIVHFTVYKTLVNYTHFFQKHSSVTFWVLAALSFSFTFGNLLIQLYPSKISSIFYHASSIWLGTLFFLFCAVLFISIFGVFRYNNDSFKTFASIILLLAASASVYGVINQKNIRIVEKEVYIKDLPKEWEGRRAGFFADSHYGPIHNTSDAQKLVNIFNSKSIDIIFMGGDFYDGPPTDFVAVGKIFSGLQPKYGKYFVTGNHEEYAGIKDALLGVEAGGFIVTDRVVTILEGVQIVGVPYVRGEDETEITSVLEKSGFKKETPSIVLKHVPLELDVLQNAGASLVLSGHTHKGQLWPFSYITKRMYKGFDYGLNHLGNTQVYTTSGSGTWGPPQRVGTQSEVAILTFKKK
jgi:uncharacterized protein